MLDSSLNGTMVLAPVRDGQHYIVDFEWQLVNHRAASLLGRQVSELVGSRLLVQMPEFNDMGLYSRFQQVVNTGVPAVFDFEYNGKTTSHWLHIQVVNMDDSLLVTFLEITRLKQIEAELIRKEMLLSEAQDLANLGSWSWDLTNNQVHWSRTVYKIFEIEDPNFQPSYSFFMLSLIPEDRERIATIIENAVKNNQPYDIDFRIRAGERLKYLESRAIPKISDRQESLEYIGIIRDLTLEKTQEKELRRSENRARRAEKAASSERMAKSIAHEIRNPLTNITLATEQLRSEVSGESAELFLDLITRNSRRIEDLIRKLMDSARQAVLNRGNYNINDILDDAIALAMDRIKLRRVRIKKEYQSDMCGIQVDGEKVKTALLNIIINAIEAVDQEGEVLVKTALTAEECLVTISDNGIGMEKNKLHQLFDPFYTGKKVGLGLGLTSTLNIINSHDANIEVESEIGKGSTFLISFKRH